jgi:hypothetical protein
MVVKRNSWMAILVMIFISWVSFGCKDTGYEPSEKSAKVSKANLKTRWSKQKEDDPYPDLSIPVYPGVSDAEHFFDRKAGMKELRYEMRARYPAYDLRHFYDNELSAGGWRQIENYEIAKAKWLKSSVGTSYVKAWTDKDAKWKFLLILYYREVPSEDLYDMLFVTARIMVNFDETALWDFMDRMGRAGKLYEFEEMISGYELDDGTYDFDLAFKENPGNQDLAEYRQIFMEILPKIMNAR